MNLKEEAFSPLFLLKNGVEIKNEMKEQLFFFKKKKVHDEFIKNGCYPSTNQDIIVYRDDRGDVFASLHNKLWSLFSKGTNHFIIRINESFLNKPTKRRRKNGTV